jgi:trans-aconitate methyltransferase
MALMFDSSADAELVFVDLCCGPGDLGRAVRGAIPQCRIIHVDRSDLMLEICSALNDRFGVCAEYVSADLWKASWPMAITPHVDAIGAAAGLHWLEILAADFSSTSR